MNEDAETTASFGPLSGVKVLDFSRVVAGPLCGLYLADLGADVIKIEAPGGDENRRWEPSFDGSSAGFVYMNRGKRGMTLNLKSPAGQNILADLVAAADVVIDSYLPSDAEVLGLTHDALVAMNPEIVHVSVTAYGGQGPMRNNPGYDLLLQAFSGIMQTTGEADGPPLRAGASVVDISTGMLAFGYTLSALYARATGRATGEHVQVSLLQSGMALVSTHIANLAIGGAEPKRQGSGLWSLVPYQAFEAADGWILIGVTNDDAWVRFCAAMELTDLAANEEYAHARGRIEHRAEVVSRIQEVVANSTIAELIKVLEPARIPVSPINTIREVVQHEQVLASGIMVPLGGAEDRDIQVVGRPVRFANPYDQPSVPAPRLGEHTTEILADLGYSADKISELVDQGAL
ncbi:CaiB/BaiF CoA transferase family protein [Nocardia jiangxiensis]|uniref:CaiB/BaiF CoA transferase family protein n=1 Tax=Nocardia jiangxiensis TaxID=282685 RepID=UPI0002FAA678|nr:CoA transferase [Nocardia jiangxiensis]